MRTIRALLVVFALTFILLFSCKQSPDYETSDETVSQPEQSISSSAAVVSKTDSTRKFIRTADLKFKVKNVVKTTYAIENITTKLGGFVAYTNLQSTTNSETTDKISADSSVVTKHFTVENNIILRVPNTKLDTVLKSIAPLIDFLDSRVIKADDVSLQMLSNKMAQNRSKENEDRLANAIDSKGKKLNDITTAEDALTYKNEQADNAKLENLSLKDQVNFSTINISMYQREEIKREMIANDRTSKYEQGFGSRIMDSLYTGWEMITAIVVFITQLWGLLLVGIITYIVFKRYKQGTKQ